MAFQLFLRTVVVLAPIFRKYKLLPIPVLDFFYHISFVTCIHIIGQCIFTSMHELFIYLTYRCRDVAVQCGKENTDENKICNGIE